MLKASMFRFAVAACFVLFAAVSFANLLPVGMSDGAD